MYARQAFRSGALFLTAVLFLSFGSHLWPILHSRHAFIIGGLFLMAAAAPVPTTWLGRAIYYVENWFSHDAWPFLSGLFKKIEMDSIALLMPLAEQTVANLETQVTPLLSQGPAGWLQAFNLIVADLYQAVQAAGTDLAMVSMTDILTAAHAVLVNLESKLGL